MSVTCHLPQHSAHLEKEYGRAGELGCALSSEIPVIKITSSGFSSLDFLSSLYSNPHLLLESPLNKLSILRLRLVRSPWEHLEALNGGSDVYHLAAGDPRGGARRLVTKRAVGR